MSHCDYCGSPITSSDIETPEACCPSAEVVLMKRELKAKDERIAELEDSLKKFAINVIEWADKYGHGDVAREIQEMLQSKEALKVKD